MTLRKAASAAALLAGVTAAQAQGLAPAKPEHAIKYRQSAMFLIGQHMAPMAQMVRGERPFDQQLFVTHAQMVETLARLPWDAYFVPGSDKGQTKVKEVQQNKDKFMASAKRMQDEVAKLVSAAKSGDQGAIRTAFGGVGRNCKDCHDNFRSE